MESKNKKEIVQHIVDRIKSTPELPYREGAWEDFHRQHAFGPKRKLLPYYWAASAAAVLIAGIFTMKYWSENAIQGTDSALANNQEEMYESPEVTAEDKQVIIPELNTTEKSANHEYIVKKEGEQNLFSDDPLQRVSSNIAVIQGNNHRFSDPAMYLPKALNSKDFVQVKSVINAKDKRDIINNSEGNNLLMGYQGNNKELPTKNELKLDKRRFKFNEHFDLGLFVSPNSTNENFNFGGGLLLSYNISKNLSVRTGLAFNKYEVGSMRDPISNAETQVFASTESIQKNTTGSLAQASMNNALLIPNINAITGNVQAFEIPVDLKLKFSKGLYVSSGIAYAVILDQNRYAHYIENANTKIFKNGLPENESQMKSAITPVTKSIKTEEQNIRTNGFGGFVNLSLGKEVKLKQSFSVSVEPFVKLPVGNFKQTDMNYTNGGIRIITNF